MQRRLNCREFKKCRREPNGSKVNELGICPATQDISFNGLNGGKNVGRICWAVAGTLCGGEKQGTFAKKLSTCMSCDFFKLVKKEVGQGAFRIMKPN